MFSDPVSMTITVLFATAGLGYLLRAITGAGHLGSGAIGRTSDSLHLLMCATMAVAPWAWREAIAPWFVQIPLFAGAAAFYAVLLRFHPVDGVPTDRARREGTGSCGRLTLGYHVAMMASMVCMAIVMMGEGAVPSEAAKGGASATAASAVSSSPGMIGMTGMHGGSATGLVWPALTVLPTIVFALGAIWYLTKSLRPSTKTPTSRGSALLLMVMSVGMTPAFGAT